MANSLYITATEARSGKSVISLGVVEMLLRKMVGSQSDPLAPKKSTK